MLRFNILSYHDSRFFWGYREGGTQLVWPSRLASFPVGTASTAPRGGEIGPEPIRPENEVTPRLAPEPVEQIRLIFFHSKFYLETGSAFKLAGKRCGCGGYGGCCCCCCCMGFAQNLYRPSSTHRPDGRHAMVRSESALMRMRRAAVLRRRTDGRIPRRRARPPRRPRSYRIVSVHLCLVAGARPLQRCAQRQLFVGRRCYIIIIIIILL